MYFFVFGRQGHYFYCESGKAVQDAKDAEHLSKAGDVIVAPYMWSYCEEKDYSFTMLDDEKHVKVCCYDDLIRVGGVLKFLK